MVKRLSLISARMGWTSRLGLALDQADTARKMSTWNQYNSDSQTQNLILSAFKRALENKTVHTSAAQKESLEMICFSATSEIPRKDSWFKTYKITDHGWLRGKHTKGFHKKYQFSIPQQHAGPWIQVPLWKEKQAGRWIGEEKSLRRHHINRADNLVEGRCVVDQADCADT